MGHKLLQLLAKRQGELRPLVFKMQVKDFHLSPRLMVKLWSLIYSVKTLDIAIFDLFQAFFLVCFFLVSKNKDWSLE